VATEHGERKKEQQEQLKHRFLEEQAVTASFFTQVRCSANRAHLQAFYLKVTARIWP